MPRGGKREGAGRPAGTGPFGEPTIAIRVPRSKLDEIEKLRNKWRAEQERRIAKDKASGGKHADCHG